VTVISSDKDVEALSLTFVAEFSATPERVWQVWEDPRQLERWWGPPGYPASFPEHQFVPGGTSAYFMTGPDGERNDGWWRSLEVDKPTRYVFEEGFADEHGNRNEEMGAATGIVLLEASGAGTRMTTITRFESPQQMEALLDMGMQEGMREAMGQIDDVLTEVPV
jgi:uncharacterized protein YndB with AHSA1/START domain